MRFAMLGSGSKGNATLIEYAGTRVLVDCGFPTREAEARLARLGVAPDSIDAILVTHEHADHLGGVGRYARRHGTTVWITQGTHRAWADPEVPAVRIFSPHQDFTIGDLCIRPYPVPHDAREPCQYVIAAGGRRLGILSDAGHVTAHMRATLSGCDALLLECNHDPALLAAGPYPASLKERVGGNRGHLANAQAAELLRGIDCSRLQHLVLTHLSEVNNRPDLARAAVTGAITAPSGADADWIVCADQGQGLDWRALA
ncbi:MAG TPA: MBL fold metallo-hydrolase [Solimonas sp.]|nr:MBL fold metallo-hydrolase [Solimonas sp.]